jgi:hypothetical protein
LASRRAIATASSLRHVLDLVDQRQVEVLGHEARAEALDLVRRRLELLAGSGSG